MYCTRTKVIVLFAVCFLYGASCFGAVEDLDEMVARKARHFTALWGYPYLEDSTNHYLWQPETLCYFDRTTNREVWRMTSTPSLENYYRDISYSPWSADGKRMGFVSRRITAAVTDPEFPKWMIVNTDGTFLRPLPNAPAAGFAHTPQMNWSPQVPDVYYEFGKNYSGEGLDLHDLYKVTVSDLDVSRQKILRFPETNSEYALWKSMSPDGKRAAVMSWDWSTMFSVTLCQDGDRDTSGNSLCPGDSPAIESPVNGYSPNRTWDCFWGNCPSGWAGYHDQYLGGAGNDLWFYVMPENTNGTWWRIRLTGSAPDGGPAHIPDHNDPFDWGGQIEPVNTITNGSTNDPWCRNPNGIPSGTQCANYMSHFTPDRWGRYALYTNSFLDSSPAVYDMENHISLVTTFGGGGQHHAWNGWTDWVVSSIGPNATDYLSDGIHLAKYNDSRSQVLLCNTHTRYNGNGELNGSYEALPRPTQSPDGTKVAFHSTFLNSKPAGAQYDDRPDLYWVVAYYPYPPRISGLTKNQTFVRINWMSPKYTHRGWPTEGSDPPPEPKEIKCYHVWVSENGSPWRELTPAGVPFGMRYYDAAQPNNSTWYYAVTSEEHSRLESRTLSNIWQITLDADGQVMVNTEITPYPSQPGGISPFWTQTPPAPKNFNVVRQATSGHYRLSWTEPSDSKNRYYNIYYSSSTVPPADQRFRIASVPVGTSTYLDWLADPNSPAHYFITSVDRQGNESTFTALTGTATNVTMNSATLNGIVNPTGLPMTYSFQWGPTTAYGNTTPDPPQSAGSGMSDVAVSVNLTNLTPDTIYHYRVVAANTVGTIYGSDKTFTTRNPGGDLNGDGKGDILWRHAPSGAVFLWLMNGSTITSQGSPATVDLRWEINGVGDFDGDGKADILWRHVVTGEGYLWLMNGLTIIGRGSLGTVNLGWKIMEVGDFDGDGKADILWRQVVTGEGYLWLMDGLTLIGQGSLGKVDLGWKINGVGDFDGDGKADILWRQVVTGEGYLWLMNGLTSIARGSLGSVDPGWEIKRCGDFNGDGKTDILWRHTNGELFLWLMNGLSLLSGTSLGPVPTDWDIQ